MSPSQQNTAMTKADPQRPPASTHRPRIGPVDIRVGRAVRTRRMSLGLTLDELAQAVGLTAQQIHKYESAQTRIPASRLNTLSQALRLPLSGFFEEGTPVDTPMADGNLAFQYDVVRLLRSVSDPVDQRMVVRLLRAIIAEIVAR